jgi:hypothetical protein
MLLITNPATISRSRFYEDILGAKLKNINWSWGVIAPATNCVFLNIWLDLMDKNNAEIFWHKYQTKSPGKPERLRHIDA